jgi:hypothetical protein
MLNERGPLIPLLTEIVATDDILRPQTTSRFNRYWTEKPFEFPLQYGLPENRVWVKDPANTRGDIQNVLFSARYNQPVPPTHINPDVIRSTLRR